MLSACTNETSESKNVFRYNQINHITSLDPAFAKSQNNIWAVHHLYNGLVALDDELNVVPSIAKRWSISDDGLTYTFYLRDDVYFHKDVCFPDSTRKVIATDIAYSLSRLIDEELNSPGSWLFSDKVEGKEAFNAIDDTTFVLQINKPFIPMMGILGMQYCSVVPKECVEYYAEGFRNQPVGTGPFRFKRWEENQALFLIKNEDYFDRTSHNLDGIKTTFIPDKKIAFLELRNGSIDFVSGLESSFIHDLLDKEGSLLEKRSDELKLHKAPFLNTEYIGINMENQPVDSPLRNKKVRQALNYAVDKDLMLKSLRNGIGKPADSGFVPSGLPSHNPEQVIGYSYNPDKARAFLKEAGFDNEHPVPQFTLSTNKDYLDITTFLARQWQEIGVHVEIDVLESSILRDGMRKSQVPFFRASWIADYPDAESFLCMFYSKYPAPPNYTRYANAEFDALYERAVRTSDKIERHQLYWEMDRMLIEDAPVIFLFYDQTALFTPQEISGISTNGLNLLKVDHIIKKNITTEIE